MGRHCAQKRAAFGRSEGGSGLAWVAGRSAGRRRTTFCREPGGGRAPAAYAPPAPTVSGEAVSALMGLGIGEPQARRAVEHAQSHLGDEAELPAVIRAALKEIGR